LLSLRLGHTRELKAGPFLRNTRESWLRNSLLFLLNNRLRSWLQGWLYDWLNLGNRVRVEAFVGKLADTLSLEHLARSVFLLELTVHRLGNFVLLSLRGSQIRLKSDRLSLHLLRVCGSSARLELSGLLHGVGGGFHLLHLGLRGLMLQLARWVLTFAIHQVCKARKSSTLDHCKIIYIILLDHY
jgi:hypothetical protein